MLSKITKWILGVLSLVCLTASAFAQNVPQTIAAAAPLEQTVHVGEGAHFQVTGWGREVYWTTNDADGTPRTYGYQTYSPTGSFVWWWGEPGTYTMVAQAPAYVDYGVACYDASNTVTFTVHVIPLESQPITATSPTESTVHVGEFCEFHATGSVSERYNWTGLDGTWAYQEIMGDRYQTWYAVGTYTVTVQAPQSGIYAPSNMLTYTVHVIPPEIQTISTANQLAPTIHVGEYFSFAVTGSVTDRYNWTGLDYSWGSNFSGNRDQAWQSVGTHTVTVQAPGCWWNPGFYADSNTITYTVTVIPLEPTTIEAVSPLEKTVHIGEPYTFEVSGSIDERYDWTGVDDQGWWYGHGATRTQSWDKPGDYTVTAQAPEPFPNYIYGFHAASNTITFTVHAIPLEAQTITTDSDTERTVPTGTDNEFKVAGSQTNYNWTGLGEYWWDQNLNHGNDRHGSWWTPGTYTVTAQAPQSGIYAASNTITFTVTVENPKTGNGGAEDQAQSDDDEKGPKKGDPIQISTGANTSTALTFQLGGARSWSFELSYNSILAATQYQQGAFGYGWTHNFEASLSQNSSTGEIVAYHNRTHWNRYAANGSAIGTAKFQSNAVAAKNDEIIASENGGWILKHKNQSSQVFDANGRLIEDIDRNGRSLVLAYDESGKLSTITEPVSGTHLTFIYNGNYVSQITDSSGASVSFSYDWWRGTLIQIVNQAQKSAVFNYDDRRKLTTITDNDGVVLTTNVYDDRERVVSQTDAVAGHGALQFDYQDLPKKGLLTFPGTSQTGTALFVTADTKIATKVTDKTGAVSLYTFDRNYRLLSVKDAQNRVVAHTYDIRGNRLTDTDPLGNTTTYGYDSNDNLTSVTDPAGKSTAMTYDSRNNLLTVTDPLGHTVTRTYDSKNNLLSVTDALGRTTSWTYNYNSQPVTQTLPGGGVTVFEYTIGLLTKITDPNGVVTKNDYDALGRVVWTEDAAGNRSTIAYDGLNNVTSKTNALGQTWSYTYNNRNHLATETDPSGAVTSYTYDNNNNVVTVTDALGHSKSFSYDAEDRPLTATDPLGHTAAKAYSLAGDVTAITDPTGFVTSIDYDGAGRKNSVTDPLGGVSSIAYNNRGLVIGTMDPLNRVTSAEYDAAGRVISATNALGETKTTSYDALNRVSSVTDAGGISTGQTFTADGNRQTFTNGEGKVTTLNSDAGGRDTGAVTATGKTSSVAYDARGLLHTATNAAGAVTTIEHDAAGRVSSIADGVGTISFTRDANGRQLTASENGKILTRTYDLLGRVTSYTDGVGNVLGYSYDAAGNLHVLTYPDGKTVTYGYDAANRLTTVTDWANRVTTYSYDARGKLLSTVRPNGTVQERIYDAAGQLTDLVELAADGTTFLFATHQTFDAIGRVQKEQFSPTLPVPAAETTFQSFDADNRLLTHNGQFASFDNEGNLLSLPGFTSGSFVYDARNRLTQANGLSYGYDSEGHRVSVTGATGTTNYMVNPENRLSQVLVKTNPDGSVTRYVYGLGLIAEETSSTVGYYHFDRKGSTVAMTDASGTVTGRASYGIYGELLTQNDLNTPFLFNGLYGVETDSNGLYFHRARYYSPVLRRFINQDFVLGDIGTASSLNRYAYANGQPVSLIDPMGLSAEEFQQQLAPAVPTKTRRQHKTWECIPVAVSNYLNRIGLGDVDPAQVIAALNHFGANFPEDLSEKGPNASDAFPAIAEYLKSLGQTPILIIPPENKVIDFNTKGTMQEVCKTFNSAQDGALVLTYNENERSPNGNVAAPGHTVVVQLQDPNAQANNASPITVIDSNTSFHGSEARVYPSTIGEFFTGRFSGGIVGTKKK